MFILGKGVIGYENGIVKFFSDSKEIIKEAEESIQGVKGNCKF